MMINIFSNVCERSYQLAVETRDHTAASDLAWRVWNVGNMAFVNRPTNMGQPWFNQETTVALSEFSDLADILLVDQ